MKSDPQVMRRQVGIQRASGETPGEPEGGVRVGKPKKRGNISRLEGEVRVSGGRFMRCGSRAADSCDGSLNRASHHKGNA